VDLLVKRLRGYGDVALYLLKWFGYSCTVGLMAGIVAVAFHEGIDWVTELRAEEPQVIFLLPIVGMAIVLIYKSCDMANDRGTNRIIEAAREGKDVPLITAPLIFISTIWTHFVGGSAGREGAALQLGGSLASSLGRKMKLDTMDTRSMVMCGMAAAFAGLFGTPITAAVFAMEVVSVGVMHYAALIPCVVAALTAFLLARLCGMHGAVGYAIAEIADLTPVTLLQTVVLGAVCAMTSALFCKSMHLSSKLYGKYLPNPYVRAAVGGVLVLLLTLLVGDQRYNGAGDGLIHTLLGGESIPEAFLLKILFTAVTLGAGFRGGEIVPVLCTGCAVGTLFGPLLGLPHGFSGALGMAAMFCGATNCPITSVFLACEMFGGEGLPIYVLCCAVSYLLSGYYGLYSEQHFAFSKFRMEFIDRRAK